MCALFQQYLDPRNRRRALLNAKQLLASIDDNNDGFVALPEIVAHADELLANPMFNARAQSAMTQ